MGLLNALKRWLNSRDEYSEISSLESRSFMTGRARTAEATQAVRDVFEPVEGDPVEPLADAELDSHTSAKALADRAAAMEHERKLRDGR